MGCRAIGVQWMTFAVAAVGLSGCPDLPEGAGGGSAEPPDESPEVPGSICEAVGDVDGGAERVGVNASECPAATGDAIRIDWYPDRVIKRRSRGSVFFNTKNLLREQVEVEYEASARMVGHDEDFSIRLAQPQRTYDPLGGGVTELDLQLGVSLDVLTEGEVEVTVAASLLRPTQTSLVEMSRVVVSTKLDDDGYIYDIDYVEW